MEPRPVSFYGQREMSNSQLRLHTHTGAGVPVQAIALAVGAIDDDPMEQIIHDSDTLYQDPSILSDVNSGTQSPTGRHSPSGRLSPSNRVSHTHTFGHSATTSDSLPQPQTQNSFAHLRVSSVVAASKNAPHSHASSHRGSHTGELLSAHSDDSLTDHTSRRPSNLTSIVPPMVVVQAPSGWVTADQEWATNICSAPKSSVKCCALSLCFPHCVVATQRYRLLGNTWEGYTCCGYDECGSTPCPGLSMLCEALFFLPQSAMGNKRLAEKSFKLKRDSCSNYLVGCELGAEGRRFAPCVCVLEYGAMPCLCCIAAQVECELRKRSFTSVMMT